MHAIKGGVTSVQLRDKNISTKSMIKQGLVLKEKLQEQNIPLIINDDVEAAISIGADGIHVGQSDMEVKDVRKEVGSSMLVGLSIENIKQAKLIDRDILDYVGISPLFSTMTKNDHTSPIGFDGLSQIVSLTRLPCVAIGGVKVHHCTEIFSRGAVGVAVISGICGQNDPELAATTYSKQIAKYQRI